MKIAKIIGSILSIIALSLCVWSIFSISADASLLDTTLNFVYFFTLLIAVFSFRISLGYSAKINPIIAGLSLVIIASSTYTWLYSPELLVAGKITLGLIPLLIGTTLMLMVKVNSKLSKIIQVVVGITAVTISSCVFVGVSSAIVYSAAVIGMIVSTIAVVGYLVFAKVG